MSESFQDSVHFPALCTECNSSVLAHFLCMFLLY